MAVSTMKQRSKGSTRMTTIAVLTLVLAVALFTWIGYFAEEQEPVHQVLKKRFDSIVSDATTGSSAGGSKGSKAGLDICFRFCSSRKDARIELYGGDILDRVALLEVAKKEKEKLVSKLHVAYGKENFENIFVDKETSSSEQRYRGKVPAGEGQNSTEILKRKLMIKMLSVQVALARKDAEASGCDCLHGNLPLPGRTPNLAAHNISMDATHARYVWATGGHSAAAGHGNLYNESYTAYMERDLKPFFASIGIDFEGRNYAMGGTSSAFEVSSCYEQIFGNDVDFFSWDFGMTDGRYNAKILHYAYRGALSPGRPAIIALHTDDQKDQTLGQLADLGVAAFISPDPIEKEMRAAIPDSAGLSDEEIDQMPEYVRNFKCSDQIENGDPYCTEDKYTKYYCPDRRLRTNWHPGYKAHAMDGHVLSLFLMQNLLDALEDLSAHKENDPEVLLTQLQVEDDNVFKTFANTATPAPIGGFKRSKEEPNWDNDNADFISTFYRGPSLCRTGRLPAKSRFLGIMTNGGKTGDIAVLGNETYETGIEVNEAKATAAESNEELRLVYAENPRDRDRRCMEMLMKPDYKDFFYAHSNDGWLKLVFPNRAEKEAYRYDKSRFEGVLALHLVVCDWGQCPEGDVREDGISSGKLDVTVNGKVVKSVERVDGLMLLVGEEGSHWEASSNDDYEIRFRVKEPDNYLRISAVLLF